MSAPPAADRHAGALEEADADDSRDVTLRGADESHEVLVQGGKPEAVVDHIGDLAGHELLEAHLVLGERHLLQLGVGRVEHHGGRTLVDLAGLDPNQAVLDVVDPTDTVRARHVVQAADQPLAVQHLAVERDGQAPPNSIST